MKAAAVMTPRPAVVAIDATATREEIVALVSRSRFARFPVHDGGLDGVTGYVLGREVLARALEGTDPPLQGIVREAPFFPEAVEALGVLRELQERHVPIGFVVDEQGGFTGLVTLEDLVEELVGEIFHEREAEAVPYREDGPGAWVVEGRAGVRDVNRALGLELPEDPAWATIAGFVLHRLERMPPAGTAFVDEESGLTIEVVESTPRRIARVRVSRPA